MLYTIWKVGTKEFRLRLTTMGVMTLEDRLGKNPVDVFVALSDGQLPKIRDIVYILHQSLQPYHSGYSVEKAAELLDTYFEEGHSIYDFMTDQVMKVFQNAGLLNSQVEEESGEEEASASKN